MKFEWDDDKAASDRRKHRVTFEEAKSVFGDPNLLQEFDQAHSFSEERLIAIGISNRGRLLTVSHTVRNGTIRIISARRATTAEARRYAQA